MERRPARGGASAFGASRHPGGPLGRPPASRPAAVVPSRQVMARPDKREKPKPPQAPRSVPPRDKPVKGWSRSKFGQAGRGRSGK
jgi:hypothetical protein